MSWWLAAALAGGASGGLIWGLTHYEPGAIELPLTAAPVPPKIVLLLTMYAEPARLPRYQAIVNQWLEKTDVPLVIVDSAGNYRVPSSAPPGRVTLVSFIQDAQGVGASSSVLERAAIERVLQEHGPRLVATYDLVCKVTAKYFVPELLSTLARAPSHALAVLQNNEQCEVYAVAPRLLARFAAGVRCDVIMEHSIAQAARELHSSTVYRLPPLALPGNRWPRGDGIVLEHL